MNPSNGVFGIDRPEDRRFHFYFVCSVTRMKEGISELEMHEDTDFPDIANFPRKEQRGLAGLVLLRRRLVVVQRDLTGTTLR